MKKYQISEAGTKVVLGTFASDADAMSAARESLCADIVPWDDGEGSRLYELDVWCGDRWVGRVSETIDPPVPMCIDGIYDHAWVVTRFAFPVRDRKCTECGCVERTFVRSTHWNGKQTYTVAYLEGTV